MRPSLTLRRMRIVELMIAITMLAVPASAYAFAGGAGSGQNEQTPLKLDVTPGKVTFGRRVTVTGQAPIADAGYQVILLTATNDQSAWRQIGVATAQHNGRFAFRIRPHRSGLLRAAIPSAPSSSVPGGESTAGIAGAPAGPIRSLTVTARFTVPAAPHAVIGGGRAHVGGTLLPAVPGRVVALQGHTSRGWHTVATGHTGAGGGFRLSFAPAASTGRRLRVLFAGDEHNAPSAHAAGTVSALYPVVVSWYDDAATTGCGFHAALGIANKTLPCGTHVTLRHGGRTVTAIVDDRGPYVAGREYDLNQNTAAALGFAGVGTIWASIA